ncbi:hypothetical protein MUK42_22226, partial [Musa troglodytarum]
VFTAAHVPPFSLSLSLFLARPLTFVSAAADVSLSLSLPSKETPVSPLLRELRSSREKVERLDQGSGERSGSGEGRGIGGRVWRNCWLRWGGVMDPPGFSHPPAEDGGCNFEFVSDSSNFSDRPLRIEIVAVLPEGRPEGEGDSEWDRHRKRRREAIEKRKAFLKWNARIGSAACYIADRCLRMSLAFLEKE